MRGAGDKGVNSTGQQAGKGEILPKSRSLTLTEETYRLPRREILRRAGFLAFFFAFFLPFLPAAFLWGFFFFFFLGTACFGLRGEAGLAATGAGVADGWTKSGLRSDSGSRGSSDSGAGGCIGGMHRRGRRRTHSTGLILALIVPV